MLAILVIAIGLAGLAGVAFAAFTLYNGNRTANAERQQAQDEAKIARQAVGTVLGSLQTTILFCTDQKTAAELEVIVSQLRNETKELQ